MKMKQLAILVGMAFPIAALADDSPVMPQIEVTAQKLGEASYTADKGRTATPLSISLRDTPQSVSVITPQRIEDQALQTVTDVVNNATGVSVNQYETHRAGFTARGFDIDNLQIDGVPTTWDQPWSSGEVVASLAIYDRVEIVRGATGLMTGAGNPSAAINLVRKRAASKDLAGSAEIGIGRWNERRAQADVSTGLNASGSVRGRFAGEYQRNDSWVDLLQGKSRTFYATVEADLAPRTVLSAGISRQKNDPQGPMWGGLPYWYSDGSKAEWDVSKTSAAGWTRWSTDYESTFANLEHSFGNGWMARASFSHGDRRSDSYLLYLSGVPDRTTGLGVGAFAGSYLVTTKQDDFSLHASGPFELAGRKHEAAFGYTHSKQRFNADSRAADYGSGYPPVGNFNSWNGAAYPEPAWGAPAFYESSETRQQGLYGVARFSISTPMKAIVGARVTNYDKDGVGAWTAAYRMKHDHELTPYAGVVYDISENLSAYASYTDIFQPQNRKNLAGDMLDPIVGKSSEAGVKGEFLDGRVNASLAVFRIKQDKLAQEAGRIDRDGSGPLGPEAYYRAADGAKSEGFEFEVSGELARNWNATAGYSQFQAEDAAGADINTVYPRKLFRVFTSYRIDALTVGGGVNWESRTYTIDPGAPANTNGLIEQDSFALANLMARYDISKNLSAQVNVNNLFDKKHFGMFAAYGAITYAAPRSVSASLKYRF
jgi:outer-membrane receptor for ferric coprogen and ferric-rhodotorulic acid